MCHLHSNMEAGTSKQMDSGNYWKLQALAWRSATCCPTTASSQETWIQVTVSQSMRNYSAVLANSQSVAGIYPVRAVSAVGGAKACYLPNRL